MISYLYMILAAFIPTLLYCVAIWATMPYKAIKLRTAVLYIVLGGLSVTFLRAMWLVNPTWFEPWSLTFFGHPEADMHFTSAFFRVGGMEELAKLFAFLTIGWARSRKDHPIGTMFYMGMVSLGFGFVENIHYMTMYGNEVLLTRVFTALPLHFMMGLIAGYWIAMGSIKVKSQSIASEIFNENRILKLVVFSGIGWLMAGFLHGLYDFNLFMFNPASFTIMFTHIAAGALACYLGALHLIYLSSRRVK